MNSTWVVVVMASCIAAAFLTEMRRKQPHLFIILNSFSVFLLILNTEVQLFGTHDLHISGDLGPRHLHKTLSKKMNKKMLLRNKLSFNLGHLITLTPLFSFSDFLKVIYAFISS